MIDKACKHTFIRASRSSIKSSNVPIGKLDGPVPCVDACLINANGIDPGEYTPKVSRGLFKSNGSVRSQGGSLENLVQLAVDRRSMSVVTHGDCKLGFASVNFEHASLARQRKVQSD